MHRPSKIVIHLKGVYFMLGVSARQGPAGVWFPGFAWLFGPCGFGLGWPFVRAGLASVAGCGILTRRPSPLVPNSAVFFYTPCVGAGVWALRYELEN
jgi:hypothetical protein